MFGCLASGAQTPLGTYNVNYLYNAAGCFPGNSFGPTRGNPYFCPSGIAPGPIFIDAAPGRYRVVATRPSSVAVWDGDAQSGRRYSPFADDSNGTVEFTHTHGQIVLYFWDWYVADNDPSIYSIVQLFAGGCADDPTVQLCITKPSDGSSPQSQFVSLSGIGSPGHALDVILNGVTIGNVRVDAEGAWEALPYLQIFSSATISIQVHDQTTGELSNTISVNRSGGPFIEPPPVPVSFLPLRHGDILVSSSISSLEYLLYGPNYTHSAIFVGGDINGTPLVAEAIITSKTPLGTITGTTQIARLESSDIWNGVNRVAAFTGRDPELSGLYRDSIVDYAKEKSASPGLPYWSFSQVFMPVSAAYPLFLCCSSSSTYTRLLAQMEANKNLESAFECATLVWRAYLEGTYNSVDLSVSNNMTAAPLTLFSVFSNEYMDQIRPHWIVPETFVRSPFLKQVF